MKDLIKLTDLNTNDLNEIFLIADKMNTGMLSNTLQSKAIILFFPDSSIRTRVSFEKGIYMLGGQSILFPNDALDKKEALSDVVGYLNNWADCIIVRHNSLDLITELAERGNIPVINAMSSVNHPCEVLSDLYAISKKKENYLELNYTFVGINGNIANAWAEAAHAFGIHLKHCCPKGYELEGIPIEYNIQAAVKDADVILTDSLPSAALLDFKDYKITTDIMNLASPNAILNPCPPFFREEEVSNEVINSDFFVGYEFKKHLLEVQQAIIYYAISK